MEVIVSRTRKVRDGEIIVQEDTWPYYAYILKEGKARPGCLKTLMVNRY